MAVFRRGFVKVCKRLAVFFFLLTGFFGFLRGRLEAVGESIYGGSEGEHKPYPVGEFHCSHRLAPALLYGVVYLKAIGEILHGVD